MITRKVLVKARLGLHARAAAKLVRLVNGFQSKVMLRRVDGALRVTSSSAGSDGVDAKSILSVLMLAATCGTELEASTDGVDEETAMEAIESLFAEGFGELEVGASQ